MNSITRRIAARTPGLALATLAALAVLSAGAATAKPGAAPGTSEWVKTEQTQLRLIAATETTGDAETLRLGLHFKLKPGWKIYWRSPGDAGFPPELDWAGSKNLKSAVMHWPVPERFSVIGLETLGYKKEVVLPLTVTREDTSKPLQLSAAIRYLVCDDICIPYDANVALTIPQGPLRPSPFAHLISRFQSAVPGDGNRHGLSVTAVETWGRNGAAMLRVHARSTTPFQAPDLYAEGPQALTFGKPTVRLGDDGLSATLDLRVFGAKYLAGADKSLGGRPLTFTLVDGQRSAEIKLKPTAIPIPADAAPLEAGANGGTSFALILLFALIGGLILNLMPCVLPVLSIKLLSVVGHGGSERRLVRLSFLASAAGILFAFLVLAGALIALKAGGMTIGWGIQFQQPWFLIAMTLLVTAFALNLWGVFEVRLPPWISDMGERASHAHGPGGQKISGHFLQGAFATLLATPCSAPFLGTAVGFALARGASEIIAIFAMLGLGLAMPYLGIAAFPGLATRLPKPGPWMVTLKRFLGLALIATGVWLLSVLTASAGLEAAIMVGVMTTAAAILLALTRLKRPGAGKRAVIGISAAVIAAFLAPGWLGEGTPGTAQTGTAKAADGQLARLWRPFDERAIPGLIAQGKTVFVDVTADWCITCQVNKALVLNQDEVLTAFQGKDVIVMQADWTRPDPMISDFLARHQRYGIPFDAVYGPGAAKGIVLPELLSKDAVLKALKRAARPKRVSSATTRTNTNKGGNP